MIKIMKVECKSCKYSLVIKGEDPQLTFIFLTENHDKKCKHCKKDLNIQIK